MVEPHGLEGNLLKEDSLGLLLGGQWLGLWRFLMLVHKRFTIL